MNVRTLPLLVGIALLGCSPGSDCLTGIECAPGKVCMRIAPTSYDITTQCVTPCGTGAAAAACEFGTHCQCPDSPSGARCNVVGKSEPAFFCSPD